MQTIRTALALLLLLAIAGACRSSQKQQARSEESVPDRGSAQAYRGTLSTPAEARVDLSDLTLGNFDAETSALLFRYLAGNARWELREERGLRYAIRKEASDEDYPTSLNGFYSNVDGQDTTQTRVLIAFGKSYGFGTDYGNITRASLGGKETELIVEGDHAGTPGNSSYLIIDGGKIFLEIYDQAPQIERSFTKAAFAEVSSELRDVLAHQEEIAKTGILPLAARYPLARPDKPSFAVEDGMQPGIYHVRAAVNPTLQGKTFLKVFAVVNAAPLSAERVAARSTRYLGWSNDGATYFDYSSEVTIYEGDWQHAYDARFELWHRSDEGALSKLAETTRSIYGWQH